MMNKTSKFTLNPDNGMDMIRWETLNNGKNAKVVAFKITLMQKKFLTENENPDVESDKIIDCEGENFDKKYKIFEWEDGLGFKEVNPEEQNWFKIKL